MAKKIILSANAPQPIGPYSQAVELDSLIFCSGQIAIDPKNGEVLNKDVQTQTKQVLENIKNVLAAAKCQFSNVVKTTIFLTDMNDFAAVNQIYAEYFKDPAPARSTVAVAGLPKGVKIEIEVIAHRNA